MTLLATLIAIAAWCGQPVVHMNGSRTNDPIYITAEEVDQCRLELWECLQKTPHNPQCFLGRKTEGK